MTTTQPTQLTPSAPEASSPASVPVRDLLIVLTTVLGVFFVGLGRLPLLEPDEGRNAEVAREMLTSGDWLMPHFNGLPYLDKPPVLFWLVAGAFRLLGVSEFAARLPSALMAAIVVLLTWFLARRLFGNEVALRAGIILATSPLVIVFARLVIFDMTLTFLVTVAVACFWLEEASDYRRPLLELLMFAAMGVATLTKGPVGFLLPLLSMLAYLAVCRRLSNLRRLHWGPGLALFFVITLPWLLVITWRDPDFPRYALWQESLARYATGQARRAGSPFYYLPVFLAGFFPWSLFLLFAGWNRLRKWRALLERAHRPVVFLLVWVGVIFLFFTVSRSKLPGYFLPACVPLSLLVARIWSDAEAQEDGRAPDWLTAGFAALIAVGLLTAFTPRLIRLSGVNLRFLGRLDPAVVGLLWPSLLYGGLILVAMGIIGRNVASRMRAKTLSAVTLTLAAVVTPVLFVRWTAPLKAYAAASSSRRLAQTIRASPERELTLYGYYCFRPSLGFYLERPVPLITADGSETTSNYIAARLPTLRRQYPETLLDARGLWVLSRTSSKAFLLLVRNREVSSLSPFAHLMEPLWSEWEYSVWKVWPEKQPDSGRALGPDEAHAP